MPVISIVVSPSPVTSPLSSRSMLHENIRERTVLPSKQNYFLSVAICCCKRQRMNGSKRRGPYRGRFECLEEDGPCILVALLGRGFGLRHQMAFQKSAARPAAAIVNARLRTSGLQTLDTYSTSQPVPKDRSFLLCGLAVMSLWRLMPASHTAATSASIAAGMEDSDLLHIVSYGLSGQQPRAVLEFPIHDACRLVDAVPVSLEDWPSLDNESTLETPGFAHMLWQKLRGGEQLVQKGSERITVQYALQRWMATYGIKVGSSGLPLLHGWRVWQPLCDLMSLSLWACDCVPVFERQSGQGVWRLKMDAPPQRLLQQYLRLEAGCKLRTPNLPHHWEALFGKKRCTTRLRQENPTTRAETYTLGPEAASTHLLVLAASHFQKYSLNATPLAIRAVDVGSKKSVLVNGPLSRSAPLLCSASASVVHGERVQLF